MLRAAMAILVVLGATGVVSADDTAEARSGSARYFRLEIGGRDRHLVSGYFDESRGTGKGFDTAVLDVRGDGVPPKLVRLERGARRSAVVRFELDGAIWSLAFRGLKAGAGELEHLLSWRVKKGDLELAFVAGEAWTYGSAEQAAAGRSTNIGAPFCLHLSAGSQARRAVVRVTVADVGGALLRVAGSASLDVEVLCGEGEAVSGRAGYG